MLRNSVTPLLQGWLNELCSDLGAGMGRRITHFIRKGNDMKKRVMACLLGAVNAYWGTGPQRHALQAEGAFGREGARALASRKPHSTVKAI